jgi:uncharacterized protein YndB with AHSA1/START domain
MAKIIRQSVTIGAKPGQVYEALINEKKHAKFTGAEASISRKVGGSFTCYGTFLEGMNLDLVPGRRIVQAWRSASWPKGTYSIATFAFSATKGGRTKLRFTHLGVPASSLKGITKGWQVYYWKPLKSYLEK